MIIRKTQELVLNYNLANHLYYEISISDFDSRSNFSGKKDKQQGVGVSELFAYLMTRKNIYTFRKMKKKKKTM